MNKEFFIFCMTNFHRPATPRYLSIIDPENPAASLARQDIGRHTMTLDAQRRPKIPLDQTDSGSTKLHPAPQPPTSGPLAKWQPLWFNAATRNKTDTNHPAGNEVHCMDNTIRYPNMGPVKKAAELYGLSPHYIRRLCKQGKIRYVNAGHMWLVNLDSLARYFEQGDPAPADSRQTAQGIRYVG